VEFPLIKIGLAVAVPQLETVALLTNFIIGSTGGTAFPLNKRLAGIHIIPVGH
jgi:hypothetical protein